MEENILDETEKKIEPPKFALKSFDQFWYSIICYTIVPIIFEILKRFDLFDFKVILSNRGGSFFLATLFLGMIGFVINFFGMRNAIKSRRESETSTWKILVGGFGNLFLFLLWIILMYYYIFNFLVAGRL
ncbi:MAG: hypothetical protein AB8F94_21480 [Saprospiraceae bacterium]